MIHVVHLGYNKLLLRELQAAQPAVTPCHTFKLLWPSCAWLYANDRWLSEMNSRKAHPFANFVDTREKLMAVMAPGRPKHCPDLSAAALDYDKPLEQSSAMPQGSQIEHRTKLEIHAGSACPAQDSMSAVVFAA